MNMNGCDLLKKVCRLLGVSVGDKCPCLRDCTHSCIYSWSHALHGNICAKKKRRAGKAAHQAVIESPARYAMVLMLELRAAQLHNACPPWNWENENILSVSEAKFDQHTSNKEPICCQNMKNSFWKEMLEDNNCIFERCQNEHRSIGKSTTHRMHKLILKTSKTPEGRLATLRVQDSFFFLLRLGWVLHPLRPFFFSFFDFFLIFLSLNFSCFF